MMHKQSIIAKAMNTILAFTTVSGIYTKLRAGHLLNVPDLISVTEELIITASSEGHSQNAFFS
ncbi:MAG: hypothetical protein PHC44_11995 [Lutispora sp.]|nr:hypothetical protein [Lutispora sp.]